jgi:glucan phosphorylase
MLEINKKTLKKAYVNKFLEMHGIKLKEVYRFIDVYNSYEKLKRVINDLTNGKYHDDIDKFRSSYENLITHNDEFFVLKDFDLYLKAHNKMDTLYRDTDKCQKNVWNKYCTFRNILI